MPLAKSARSKPAPKKAALKRGLYKSGQKGTMFRLLAGICGSRMSEMFDVVPDEERNAGKMPALRNVPNTYALGLPAAGRLKCGAPYGVEKEQEGRPKQASAQKKRRQAAALRRGTG